MRNFFQWGGKEGVEYEWLHNGVSDGKITGPIIFSIRWEMASWPILFVASLPIAAAVLRLSSCLKLKGVIFGAVLWGICKAASRCSDVSGG